MPIGVICNCLSVALGGLAGALFGSKLNDTMKEGLTIVFGLSAMTMGISAITLMQNMPAVIFSVVVGTAIGISSSLGKRINALAVKMEAVVSGLLPGKSGNEISKEMQSMLVTVIVLFCASGTGIYGSIDSGMTGSHTILISKSILDFFTAMIFAANLGTVVAFISIPQFFIFMALYLAAGIIYPLTTPMMVNDFKACGGILLLGTAFRMMKIKDAPLADMIPAMIIVMPISWIWVNFVAPLL